MCRGLSAGFTSTVHFAHVQTFTLGGHNSNMCLCLANEFIWHSDSTVDVEEADGMRWVVMTVCHGVINP